MQEPARFILMYVVFPLWVAAGFADWACHRRTRIEKTSGLKENLLHLLMFGEIGIGMAAAALLQVNAAVLLFVLAVFIGHELTVYWDLRYTTPLREVKPFEQMVHSFLELLPLLSLALLAAMAWPQAMALAGLGVEPADWALRAKAQPLPPLYLAGGCWRVRSSMRCRCCKRPALAGAHDTRNSLSLRARPAIHDSWIHGCRIKSGMTAR